MGSSADILCTVDVAISVSEDFLFVFGFPLLNVSTVVSKSRLEHNQRSNYCTFHWPSATMPTNNIGHHFVAGRAASMRNEVPDIRILWAWGFLTDVGGTSPPHIHPFLEETEFDQV